MKELLDLIELPSSDVDSSPSASAEKPSLAVTWPDYTDAEVEANPSDDDIACTVIEPDDDCMVVNVACNCPDCTMPVPSPKIAGQRIQTQGQTAMKKKRCP